MICSGRGTLQVIEAFDFVLCTEHFLIPCMLCKAVACCVVCSGHHSLLLCVCLGGSAHCGLHAGALQAYEQSLSAASECSTVYCNKAATLAKLGRHDDAIAAARQALKINTEYDKARKRMNDSRAALRQQ